MATPPKPKPKLPTQIAKYQAASPRPTEGGLKRRTGGLMGDAKSTGTRKAVAVKAPAKTKAVQRRVKMAMPAQPTEGWGYRPPKPAPPKPKSSKGTRLAL